MVLKQFKMIKILIYFINKTLLSSKLGLIGKLWLYLITNKILIKSYTKTVFLF